MNIFKKFFRKEPLKEFHPMPPWEEIVKMLYDKQLGFFSKEIVRVVYSKDKAMRYIVLKDKKGLFTYHLESIYQFDENEWNYICSDSDALPAIWTVREIGGKSFFSSEEELFKEIKTQPEYKKYFC